jgi:ubiquinone biosynthesis accessory factor UbiK
MMDTFRIDEIARRLMENVPPAFRAVQQDLESNFRAVLRASLNKLDLVTRDEFDTQSRVLERTRARLEALEARLHALEGGGPGYGLPEAGLPATDTPAAGEPAPGTPGGGLGL